MQNIKTDVKKAIANMAKKTASMEYNMIDKNKAIIAVLVGVMLLCLLSACTVKGNGTDNESQKENASVEHGFSSEGLPSGTDGAGSQVAEEDMPSGMEDMYKAILLGEEDFVAIDFRDGDRRVNIENIIEVVSDEDVAAEVTKFAIVDLDGNGEDEIVLWIQWLGDRVFGYEILFYQDQEVYGFTLPDRGFVNPKADGTFNYLDNMK